MRQPLRQAPPSTHVRRAALRALLAASVLATLPAASVAAAARPQPEPPAPAPETRSESQRANEAFSALLARQASTIVRSVPEPQPSDFQLAALFLQEAILLNPSDTDLHRRLIEALAAAGDDEAALQAVRALVAVDPADTVAQLKLISGQIRRLQNAEQRLAAYERFLGARGEAIDPAIRSRLALDAALLARERGDVDEFTRYLTLATQLDSTNKDAAALAVTFFTQSVDDAPGRLDLLLNLLKADPMDPATHLAIGRELAAGGAFQGARRFYDLWNVLLIAMQVDKPIEIPPEEAIITWRLIGAERVVADTWSAVEDRRSQLRAQAQEQRALGLAAEQIVDPDAEVLALPSARVLVAAASALDDVERTRWALSQLERAVTSERNSRLNANPPEQGPTPDVEGALLWLRLWSGEQLDQAAADLAKWRDLPGINPVAIRRADAWLALRRGEFDQASSLLNGLPADDVYRDLGLALIAEQSGRREEAAQAYAAIATSHAGALPGAWAATRAERILGSRLEPSPDALQLQRMIDAVPTWLDDMLRDPRRFISLLATPVESDRGIFDPLAVRARLRNITPIPMAVSPEGPINSRLLLMPAVDAAMERLPSRDLVVVGLADQRLRLMPQESFDVVIPADRGRLGDLSLGYAGRSLRVRYRVIQGFEAVSLTTGTQTFQQGPLCVASEAEPYTRQAVLVARAERERLEGSIRAGGPIAASEAVAGLSWRLDDQAAKEGLPFQPGDVEALMTAIAEKYPLVSRTQRGLWIFAALPATALPEFAPVDDALRNETDPVLAALVAITRWNGDAASIDQILAGADPWSKRAAPLIRSYLRRAAAAATLRTTPAASPGPAPR